MKPRKCTHDDSDRYPSGLCRICQAQYEQNRKEREAKRGAITTSAAPPAEWHCPACGTASRRWICSPRCLSVVVDATIAGVDFRNYREATP